MPLTVYKEKHRLYVLYIKMLKKIDFFFVNLIKIFKKLFRKTERYVYLTNFAIEYQKLCNCMNIFAQINSQ